MTDMIMSAGSPVFWIFAACWILLAVVFRLILGKKSFRTRQTFLFFYGLAIIVLYVVYKGRLLLDTEYAAILGNDNYGWINELPLQLCNVMMLIYPAAVLMNRKKLLAFLFYNGVLGTVLAIFMPSDGFGGYSLTLPRVLGYYSYHWMLFTAVLMLLLLNLYRPDYRDVLPSALSLLAAAFVAYLVDKLLIFTGIDPTANYWFVVDPSGNTVFSLFHKIIPLEYLYISLCEIVMIPVYLLLTFVCSRLASCRAGKTEVEQS